MFHISHTTLPRTANHVSRNTQMQAQHFPSAHSYQRRRKRRFTMVWVMFVVGAVLSWGMYGPALHKGQVQLGSPLRALLCVGLAYFLIGVLVPVISLSFQGGLTGFTTGGAFSATLAGALGALGAVCIIWAFKT